jgi:L,D-peptidoglycan transpeptidase YkuD (ErfK/YbiS/YcfS/YnhG family)
MQNFFQDVIVLLKKNFRLLDIVIGVITVAVIAISVTLSSNQSLAPANKPAITGSSILSSTTSSSISGSRSSTTSFASTTNGAVSSVNFDQKSVILKIGDTYPLSARVTPGNAAGGSLSWSSSEPSVAIVNNTGLITAKGVGNAVIRAVGSDGKSDTCIVAVISNAPETTSTPLLVYSAPMQVPTPGPGSFYGNEFDGSSQVITVIASSMGTSDAVVNAYQKIGESWEPVFSNLPALIGKNGMVYGDQRIQGTNTTPSGVYGIPFAFGFAPNPGTKLEYRVTDSNSYWDGNSGSATYNRWVEGNPGGDYEQLQTEPLYKYAFVLDFNWDQTAGRGAGIFVHLKPHYYTGGCVGIDEVELVHIMQWLDPAAKPKVVIFQQSDIAKYYR